MKQVLLLFSFLFLGSVAYGQTSFKERLSFNYHSEKIDVKIFPNPTINYFKISENDKIKKIEVFNLTGRVVKKYKYSKGADYFIGDLPKGIYLVQFSNSRDKIIITKRISKR